MKIKNFLNVFFVGIILFIGTTIYAQSINNVFEENSVQYHPGQLIVKFKENKINLEQTRGMQVLSKMEERQSFYISKVLPQKNIVLISIDENQTIEDEMSRLSRDPNIEFVQPNFLYKILMDLPNDTYFDYQRGLDNNGQIINGKTGNIGADIDWLAAMDIWSGDSNQNTTGTIVAVIDVGIQYEHPEFIGQLWDGSNCYNGNIQIGGCVFGFDTLDEDNDPISSDSHGTYIAGILGAKIQNASGIAGINPGIKIMSIRAGSESVGLSTVDIVEAIDFAKYNGAKIINASRGITGSTCSSGDSLMYDAIADFPGLFVVAAGNSSHQHTDDRYQFPADFNKVTSCRSGLDNIISVAATNNRDQLAWFSDYGSNIDIAAPGERIYSTVLSGNYNRTDGTSMAAPFVAALASLARSMRPELSYLDIKNAIIDQAEYLEVLSSSVVGGKRLNAFNTLQYLYDAQIWGLSGYVGAGITTLSFMSGDYISGTQSYFERNPPYYVGTLSGYHVSLGFSGGMLLDTGITTTGIVISFNEDGEYVFSVYPILSDNITGNTLSSKFYVDTTSPAETIFSPVSSLRNGNLFRSSVVDTGVGMSGGYYNYQVYLSGGEFVATGMRFTTGVSLHIPYNGEYVIGLSACDKLDNCSAITTGKFMINKPLSLNFTPQTNKELSTIYTSNGVILTGLITGAKIIIQGGLYSINGGTEQTETRVVYNCDKITISLTSSSLYSSTTSAVLSVGGLTGDFSITTKSAPSLWGAGGGGGGGGAGISVKICTLKDLICSGTTNTGRIYIKKQSVTCEGGNLGMSCNITGTVVKTGTQSQNIQYHLLGLESSNFSLELRQAYSYAYGIGITTVSDIEKAALTGTLIRKHLAKMISNFAINVLDKQSNTGINCVFEDMGNETVEMKTYAKLACQLGLMGLKNDGTPNTFFNPNSEVTRAQFGTVLSRVLRGNIYNTTEETYFTKHLASLNKIGIMKNIGDPFNLELRGWVMLMMMRVNETIMKG